MTPTVITTDNYTAHFLVWHDGERKRRILHREDGPAIMWKSGSKGWYIQGRLHRLDGPALEWADGTKSWYRNGALVRSEGPTAAIAAHPRR